MKPIAVRLWHLNMDRLEEHSAEMISFLNAAERKRASSFRHAEGRLQFVATRAALRIILGRMLEVAPSTVEFHYTKFGKPYLAKSERTCGLEFSVAHTDGRALIALTQEHRIGVDIEKIEEDAETLRDVRGMFSEEEQFALGQLSGDDETRAFYRCWVRKEAFVKALGMGIGIGLQRFAVSVGADDARLLRVDPTLANAHDWSLAALDGTAAQGTLHAAALALEGGWARIEHSGWPD